MTQHTDFAFSMTDPELQSDYDSCIGKRSYMADRWEMYSGWTLPHVFPTDTYENTAEMQNDYQSVGAQAVNHLANKIVNVLLPKGRSFFRVDLTEEQSAELDAMGVRDQDQDVLLIAMEKAAMKVTDKMQLRVALIHAVKQLIITGNALLYLPEDQTEMAQSYNLKNYVIKRTTKGEVTYMIMRDSQAIMGLPEELKALCQEKGMDEDAEIFVYTGVRKVGNRYHVKQELGNIAVIPNSKGVYQKETLPWIPIHWNLPRGYDYGIGLVEEYAGDFDQLSILSESYRNMVGIAADIKFLVNPMGRTNAEDLNEAVPGQYVPGHEDDIGNTQLEKAADIQQVLNGIDIVTRRLGSVFLLNTAVTRNAERVTAEEIRMQVAELEESLGGLYSQWGVSVQLPAAKRILKLLDPKLRKIEPTILTGVESLSRTSELDQIKMFFIDLAELNNVPEEFRARLKVGEIMNAIGARRQIDYKDFVMTDEEFQKQQQQNTANVAQESFATEAGKAQGALQNPQG